LSEKLSPRLIEGEANLQAAQGLATQSAALPNPTISYASENFGGSNSFARIAPVQNTLSLSETVEIGGKRGARIAAEAANVQAAKAGYEEVRADFARDLATRERNDADSIGALPVMLPARAGGEPRSLPLRPLATFRLSEGLNEVSRDNGKRRTHVEANVRGRDLASYVADAQAAIDREVKLPAGSWLEWGGQFQNLQAAKQRLAWVVPICVALIFAVLYMALDSALLTLTVFTAVPLAVAGGVFTLALRGMPFSISAAVGFIAVSGVAVLNGLVLMGSIRRKLETEPDVEAAILHRALERVRPVLMTALVASLGFVPMALATRAGAEVHKPLATVVIGGLITSTALTLFVLPAVYRRVLKLTHAGRSTGAPLPAPAET
jgi:cobalt-zinc-cadmium resistance protein CzcA